MRGEAALLGVILGESVRPSPFDLAAALTFIISAIYSPVEGITSGSVPGHQSSGFVIADPNCKTQTAGGISWPSGGVVLR